ncbi:anaphase-promoting complex subunit 6 [Geosmithia morbida]|uniref:Anaphase-promoting complex subunit 6 n=1 Tax=Geosmithia morbida TaxID=1094350 RepID=A0A9P4YRL1_9HYPO|nr:anaphase-promoting complex subunit 6 [Geosmithia morbida]KAF4120547.1 anaphase-promoting complex subunit 6 [Geosmithia morbida]
MEKFLREWRQDALNKAQYDSAIFIGDKLLALTNDDNDAFWLAQVHFATGNYTRAHAFLLKQDLIPRSPACRYLAGHCLIKQSRFDEALSILGERNPTHLISQGGPSHKRSKSKPTLSRQPAGRRRIMVTNSNDGTADDDDDDSAATTTTTTTMATTATTAEEAADRRFEAAMCFLRGICYAKQNAFDRAKECYKDAVRIDVQCFEAFQQLMKNSLLSPEEEWTFLESLNFDSVHVSAGEPAAVQQEAADFTRMLYTTRLSKYRNPEAFESAYDSLSTHYRLGDNPDLQLARADVLYTQCRYRDALAMTSAILEADKYNFSIYPVHLACLYELGMRNMLFLISHDLADSHPEEPCTWLAVGIYYLSIDRIAEARRYFSKASMMDAHFGPAWIGFAHTFAAEGEHDQAISAYSTAARLFMGTHLPQVFLGMQNHALNNMTLADEFLKTAHSLCRTDPLLLNEMGVVKYHQDRPRDAVACFTQALRMADEIDSEPSAWLAARTNLGHAFRRLRIFDRALAEFDEVLRLGGKDPSLFCAKGLILMELDRPDDAVAVLHEALAMNPQDTMATELLNRALDETALMDGAVTTLAGEADRDALDHLADFENHLEHRKLQASLRVNGRPDANGRRRPPGGGILDKGKETVGRMRTRGRVSLLDDDESGMMEVTDDEN